MKRKESFSVPPQIFVLITMVIMLILGWSFWKKAQLRPSIQGSYSTACMQEKSSLGQTASIKKSYTFSQGEWTLIEQFFSDESCMKKTITRTTKGVYELGDPSQKIQGANHIEMGFASIFLQPHTLDSAQALEQLQCTRSAWQVDTEQEIGKNGCGNLAKNISNCPMEFTLVKKENNTLTFGDDTKHYCTRYDWPNTLSQTTYEKQP